MAYRSRQRKYGGGKFKSERQRKFMWAVVPGAAKKWAHNRRTRKGDWARAKTNVRGRVGVRTSAKRALSHNRRKGRRR